MGDTADVHMGWQSSAGLELRSARRCGRDGPRFALPTHVNAGLFGHFTGHRTFARAPQNSLAQPDGIAEPRVVHPSTDARRQVSRRCARGKLFVMGRSQDRKSNVGVKVGISACDIGPPRQESRETRDQSSQRSEANGDTTTRNPMSLPRSTGLSLRRQAARTSLES